LKARLAITGGIACGKSVVGALLSRRGVPVRDADDLAHEVLESDGTVRDAVRAAFGEGVFAPDGTVDRRRVAEVVFSDAVARARLEAIMHPPILRLMRRWIDEQLRRSDIVAGIVPILFEIGDQANWDVVLCVTAPVEVQKRRLLDRGLSAESAELRMAAQMRTAEKVRMADFVVANHGTLEILGEQVDRVLRRIRQELV
jgi:dephospho-CoA kinase